MRGGGSRAFVDTRPSESRLLVALVAVQVLFGGMAVAGKLVLPFVPPLALALCRLGAAAAVLFALERVLVRSPMPPAKDLGRFAFFALLGVVLNQGLFLTGLQHSTATNAVLLVATIPAFTLLVAVVLGRERTTWPKAAGLALSFAGILVLVLGSLDLGLDTLVGNVLIVLNALSYSAYLVLSKPHLGRYDPLTLIAWVFLFGFAEMALVAAPQLLQADWAAVDAPGWASFAYILVGATILTYGLNNWVLRHTSASHVANFVYLQPVVGALAAWLILDEPLTWRIAAAGALIFAGVALATREFSSRRAGKPF